MGENNLELFFQFLNFNGHQMNPCSKNEIAKIMQLSKEKNLPQNYVKFMEQAGNGIDFFKGSSYTLDEISKLKSWAIALLKENDSNENIDDNNFVFLMHQGYQFYFFNLNEGDNPPVYFYLEGDNLEMFIKKYESFSGFLIEYYNETY
ncbi:MAG: SMI1/KNR4 family protein [Oscillospiraceae bacterium]|nr:SMI1/KNR4 family protein [Oscillospiraceae bacterium]